MDRRLKATPQARFYAWLTSVPGSMLYNTPIFKLHEELQIHAENRLLDIGCGSGGLLQIMAARVPFERYPVGIDLSRPLLMAKEQDGEGSLLQATVTNLPLADESFDIITCGYMARRLAEDGLLALLREMRRVLKLGGLGLIWDFSPTGSRTLNTFHERLLGAGANYLRSYTELSAYALEAGFEWVANAHLRPFLFPPIPRASVIVGKAPIGWQPPGMEEGLTPDTLAETLIAGVSRRDQ